MSHSHSHDIEDHKEENCVDVIENILNIERTILKMKKELSHFEEQAKFTQEEILRLEGCRIVFKGFEESHILKIYPNKPEEVERPKIPTGGNGALLNELYQKYNAVP